MTDDGVVLDASGRGDGLYGVQDDVLASRPFARVADITKKGAGVDASGKRFILMKLSDAKTADFMPYTSQPAGTSIALVANGHIASMHKVKVPITSGLLQVSCCDPAACDAWDRLLQR